MVPRAADADAAPAAAPAPVRDVPRPTVVAHPRREPSPEPLPVAEAPAPTQVVNVGEEDAAHPAAAADGGYAAEAPVATQAVVVQEDARIESGEPPPEAGPQVMLEISGLGVATRSDGITPIPAEQRRIGPSQLPLTVGRRHQRALLQEAVATEYLRFLSRDHFRIFADDITGALRLLALTENPIWRDRLGELPHAVEQGAVVDLAHGDSISLGTVGTDSGYATADQAQKTLSLRVSVVDAVDTASSDRAATFVPARDEGQRGAGVLRPPGSSAPRYSEVSPWLGGIDEKSISSSPPLGSDVFGVGYPMPGSMPAAPMVRQERPSELCSPAPRLLETGSPQHAEEQGDSPQFGSGSPYDTHAYGGGAPRRQGGPLESALVERGYAMPGFGGQQSSGRSRQGGL